MKKEKIIIGSRGSKLAVIYAQKAKDRIIQNTNLEHKDIIIKKITTKGDQVKDVRLSEVGGKGLFSTNIEKELQEKKIDIGVHALKDLPALETDGLIVDTFLERNDPREILISINKKKIKELKSNAIIGTSSLRREFQIKNIRTDLNCKLIRGNVDTRIKKLNDKIYDAIILSLAGINSLNFNNHISQIFSINEIIPSAGQGVVALQCREGDNDIIEILKKINDQKNYQCIIAERNVLKVLEGDCETAIGAISTTNNKKITLEAELFSLDGTKRYYHKETKDIDYASELGLEVGKILKKKSKGSYKK